MAEAYDFRAYFEHGMQPHEHEVAQRDEFNKHLPDTIIDVHVHAAEGDSFDPSRMSDFAYHHMVSTYPETTIEQSAAIDKLMMPEQFVRKLRFAHAFSGVNHKAANEYLVEKSPAKDKVALFGLSDSSQDIEYTIEELRSGKYNGLKMYYMSSPQPKRDLYDYFPPVVLKEAEKQGIPIILHFPNTLRRSQHELEALVMDFPHLQVMLAHVGVTWVVPPDFDNILERVASHQNVFVDTSGVTEAGVLQKAIEHLGPGRILYGSDEPYNILREFTYENPQLGPRILSDYPYHWVDHEEYNCHKAHIPENVTYSQLQQVDALLVAVRGVAKSASQEDSIKQQIFHDNAVDKFGF